MRKFLWVTLLLSGCMVFAQDNSTNSADQNTAPTKGQVTVRGCVGRSGGDYTLMKQNPEMTYELQGTGKIRLKNYLGQRVEVTGNAGPTLSSSSDSTTRVGSAAPVTINIKSIKTLDKDCSESDVSR